MEASRWFSLSLLYLESRGRTQNQRNTVAVPRTEEVAHKVLNHEHVSPSDNSRACPTCLSKLLEVTTGVSSGLGQALAEIALSRGYFVPRSDSRIARATLRRSARS